MSPDRVAKAVERLRFHLYEKKGRHDFERGRAGAKLPRNHNWRAYRLTERGEVLGATVARFARTAECLEIDVFLTTGTDAYPEAEVCRAVVLFCMSEAFKTGGALALLFTKQAADGRVPPEVVALAAEHGVTLSHVDECYIDEAEFRALYLALTDLEPAARDVLGRLGEERLVSPEKVCYLIHRGVWTAREIAAILLSTPFPELALAGRVRPEHRLLWADALSAGRGGLLGGCLDRALSLREGFDGEGRFVDVGGRTGEPTRVEFEPVEYCRRYTSRDGPLTLSGWTTEGGDLVVEEGAVLAAYVRAWDAPGLAARLGAELRRLSSLGHEGETPVIVVSGDLRLLSAGEQMSLRSVALERNLPLLVSPDTTLALDNEVRRRFARGRITRG